METTPHRANPRRRIRVLIVEDIPADAELMLQGLRRSGIDPVAKVVREEPDFREALASFSPEVVLIDYSLPRFSGRKALGIARREDPLLPVILVTGTLQEQRILRMMSMGLSSYVQKDRMLRLGPEVIHALDRAESRRRGRRDRAALVASERRFRAVAEASGDALLIADEEGRVVYVNPAAERSFNCTAMEALGAPVSRFVPEAARAGHEHRWASLQQAEAPLRPFTREVAAIRSDGIEFPAELTVSSWEEEGRRFYSAQLRDITARKAEARLRQTLSQAVEQTVNSVIITDLEGTIEYVNPAFCRMTGYEVADVVGRTPRILKSGRQDPAFYDALWRDLMAGKTVETELTNRRKDGSEYQQRTVVFPILGEDGQAQGYTGIGQDVTQERLLERQFRQAQKMEAVGQLAGGIAHDFNNILTGILTNAQLLEAGLPKDDTEGAELIGDVVAAARRGGDLVRRLMAMARADADASRAVDLRTIVDEAARTVRRILPENIEISVEHQARTMPSVLDDSGMHQALLNLCNNARDAMPEGGTLTIRTRVQRGMDGAPDMAVIEVVDSGVGMDRRTAERVFEPFFTTKEVGKGTGLGLAMVYGFATRAGGSVSLDSELGRGTSMTLTVPLRTSVTPDRKVAPLSRAPAGTCRGTILVAEDQDEISRVARKVLERMGYTVITAANGAEALEILERERHRVTLVLADLIMPRGGGGMLYRATDGWTDRPLFLFTSGYGTRELNGDGELLNHVPFLAKPWSVEDLEKKVMDVMGAV